MSIQAVVFDFDGTLVDASEAICSSFNTVLSARGVQPRSFDWIKQRIGRPLTEMFGQVLPEASASELLDLVSEYRAVFFPLSIPKSRAMPGAREALERMGSRARLAIATSRKADGAEHILQGLGMRTLFSVIIGIDEVRRPKPDPESILRALGHMHIDAQHAAMVGDTADDMIAARAAAVVDIGITTGSHDAARLRAAGAHHVVDSLNKVAALVLAPERDTSSRAVNSRGG